MLYSCISVTPGAKTLYAASWLMRCAPEECWVLCTCLSCCSCKLKIHAIMLQGGEVLACPCLASSRSGSHHSKSSCPVLLWGLSLIMCRLELLHPHPETSKMVLWGGTCMYLPQQQLGHLDCTCLIGTEGGAVFRCSLDMSPASLGAFAQACTSHQPVMLRFLQACRLGFKHVERPLRLGLVLHSEAKIPAAVAPKDLWQLELSMLHVSSGLLQ